MPTHRLISETHEALGESCSLCDTGYPAWVYRSRSEVSRVVRDTGMVVDQWAESTWCVCHVCAHYVERRSAAALLQRMTQGRDAMKVNKRNILTIGAFFEQLLPGRSRLGGVEGTEAP